MYIYIYIYYKGTCLDMVMEYLWDNYRMVVGMILGTVILGYLWSMIIQSEIHQTSQCQTMKRGQHRYYPFTRGVPKHIYIYIKLGDGSLLGSQHYTGG